MTIERNDGKPLENLVRLVEGLGLPPGYSITRNSPVYDGDGNQIAELDILVTGTHGTVTHRTLFECRDRPSSGPADGAWIQQLMGRRHLLRLDTVVAVSSTGFSPGAIAFARDANIPLRSVVELTADEIRGFLPRTAPLINLRSHAENIELEILQEGVSPNDFRFELQERERIPIEGQSVVEIETGNRLTVDQLWKRIAKNSLPIFETMKDNERVETTIELEHEWFSGYRLEVGDQRYTIRLMRVQGHFTKTRSTLPMTMAVNYGKESGRSTVVARWQGSDDGINELVLILRKLNEDQPPIA